MNSAAVAPRLRERAPLLICVGSVTLSLIRFASRARGELAAGTSFDDAYMFLRYADNLLAGDGVAWNPGGEAVYGVSSLLYLFVVTFLRWTLSLGDATLLSAASTTFALAAVIALVVVCARNSTALPHRPLLWAALLFPVLTTPEAFLFHAASGMDTTLSLLCNTLLVAAVLRLKSAARPIDVGLAVGAAYLAFSARPDNGLYAVLFPVLFLVLVAKKPGRTGRRVLWFLAGLGGLLLVDAALKWMVFGDVLPLPLYAKRLGYYVGYAGGAAVHPLRGLSVFLGCSVVFLVPVVAFGRRRSLPLVAALLVPVALTVAYYFSVVQIMGMHGRFYFPSLPFVVVAGALVFDDWLAHRPPGALAPPTVAVGLAAGLAVAFLGPPLLTLATMGRSLPVEPVAEPTSPDGPDGLPEVAWRDAVADIAQVADEAPPGVIIAASEHGMLGARAPHVVLIDLMGLHDRAFAHDGFSAAELFRRRPDLIWGAHRHYVGIRAEIHAADALWRDYLVYPDAFAYGLALRKDSPHLEVLSASVQARWRLRYPGLRMADHRAERPPTSAPADGPRAPGAPR